MYFSFVYRNQKYFSWGAPRSLPKEEISDIIPDYDVKIYQGEEINQNEKVLFSMQGDSTLGLGDSIWLLSYIRDVYAIKGKNRCQFDVSTSVLIANFYSNFLPRSIQFTDEYVKEEQFLQYDHKLPSMYFWTEQDGADRSWIDKKSRLERLYDIVGIEYDGLPDFSDFTNEELLYPNNEFYKRLKIQKNDQFVFFQWHSSGQCRNLPPANNIKIIKHLISKYGFKIYIIGRLNGLDELETIEGVINLSNKTTAEDLVSLAFASQLVVCPDTSGIHLAEAFRIPAVGILATFPPSYIASKYKIPSFMFGSGYCPHKPCGYSINLPLDKCPIGTKRYCAVLQKIDLDLFDTCITKTFENRNNYRCTTKTVDFYKSQSLSLSAK